MKEVFGYMSSRVEREKVEVLGLIKKTFKNFKFNFKETIIFEMFYRMLAMFILVPINYFIIKYFIKSAGIESIANRDFLNFGLTVKGMICIGIIVVISFCMIFFEIGALTYIGVKSHRGEKVRLLDGVFNSFAMLKDTMDIGMIPLVIITGVIGPLTGLGLCSSLIRKFTIPPFITIELKKTLGGRILLGLIILILVVLLLRWALAIPTVVIEKIKGKYAVKKSYSIYKRNRWKLFRGFILWGIIMFLIGIIALGSVVGTGMIVGDFLGNTSFKSMIFLGAMSIVFYIIFIVFSLVATPLFSAYLVELYYELRYDSPLERDFKTIDEYKNNKLYITLNKLRKPAMGLTIVLFVIMVSVNGYNVISKRVINKNIMITAHRGASTKAPENTLAAVEKAVEVKADYAEIDVQTTKDNKVVLFHDSTLKRINGSSKKINELTLNQVNGIDGGSYFSSEFKGENIPTLDEVLKYSKGKIKLNIELKPMGKDDTLVDETIKLIKENNMENDVVISSIDYESLMKVEKIAPTFETGYIVLGAVGDFQKLNVDFFSLESALVKPETIYALHALDKEVHVFTINNTKLAEKMVFLGVDNIITDNVPLVQGVEDKMREDKELDYVTMYYEGIVNIVKYAKI